MEMADYERLVKELNVKLTEKDQCEEELKAQIGTLTQKQETLREEMGTNCVFGLYCLFFVSPKLIKHYFSSSARLLLLFAHKKCK